PRRRLWGGGRGNHLHRDVRRQDRFQSSLEVAFDQVVNRALAACADDDLFAAVDGGVFGDQLGGVGAGVVDRQHRHAGFVAEFQKPREGFLGGGVVVDRELLFAV